jgi:hypothetical protein
MGSLSKEEASKIITRDTVKEAERVQGLAH